MIILFMFSRNGCIISLLLTNLYRLYQFLWDIVKCIAIILTARAWKSLYTPNRIQ